MITKALLTIAMAGTVTNTASNAFDTVSAAAVNVSNVYAAAGQIMGGDLSDPSRISAEERMYQAASNLEDLAGYAMRGEQPTL